MDAAPALSVVSVAHDPDALVPVRALLAEQGLGLDDDVELFVTAHRGDDLVGCMGLAGNVVKCSAISDDERGFGLSARLMQEVTYQALDRGRSHLFVYTKPTNRRVFESLGFTFLAEVPGTVVLLENSPFGLARTCRQLRRHDYVPATRVGVAVLNANPFTRGHEYLVRTAAQNVDVLHVWVVSEDASMFSADERFELVRAGCAAVPEGDRIRVRRGTDYTVSRATFPSYFLGDEAEIVRGAAGLDLQLFREHLGPAIGATDRFVGTEPLSPITNLYNQEMHHWLEEAASASPTIRVHEIERVAVGDAPVSASRVRALFAAGRLDELDALVPPTTLAYLRARAHTGQTSPTPSVKK